MFSIGFEKLQSGICFFEAILQIRCLIVIRRFYLQYNFQHFKYLIVFSYCLLTDICKPDKLISDKRRKLEGILSITKNDCNLQLLNYLITILNHGYSGCRQLCFEAANP